MKSSALRVYSLFAFGALAAAFVVFACELGGNEGDRCNPLVERDECQSGLHCKAASCTESYCCPINGPSSDPHCNAAGCPDTDAAADAGADAAVDAPQG